MEFFKGLIVFPALNGQISCCDCMTISQPNRIFDSRCSGGQFSTPKPATKENRVRQQINGEFSTHLLLCNLSIGLLRAIFADCLRARANKSRRHDARTRSSIGIVLGEDFSNTH